MEQTPRFLFDEEGFYYNPESPEFPYEPGLGRTWEDLKKMKFRVNLYRDGRRIMPGDKQAN
jgi:hypothetical protein